MALERLVAVSYPVDADYVRINSEILDAEVVYTYELRDAARREVLRRAEVLVAWDLSQEVPAGALAEASRLRLVQLLSAGVDSVDFPAIPDRLVVASNAGAYAAAMSEHVLAMTLSLAKRLPQRHAAMARGRYDKWEPLLTLDGAICGILGFGGIGTATARLMRAFGARIHAINRTGRTSEPVEFAGTLADLDRVLAVADVLLVSLPLTLATRGLLGGRELALMKPAAILVNVARGAIIDQGALYEHLRAHPQFGAGIDTWWEEPARDAPFRTDYPFFDLPNLIGSPHNSSIVAGTMLSAARVAAQNVVRYLSGEPVNGVVRRADYVAEPGRYAPLRANTGGSMDNLSVGIIGAGWMAQEHRRVLGSLDGVSLDAVCDTDRERAEDLASGTGARVYLDWRDLLDREDLGALVVAIPPLAHREPAVEALGRGLPVYLEKPIARTLEDAAAIVAAAEAAGTVCAVGYQWHALDVLGDLRRLLEGEQIGLLVGTSIGPTQSRPWFLDRRAGGGNLLERGSHHLDLARAVGGDVVSVQAAAGRVRLARSTGDFGGDIDDAVTILLELASGALATIVVAWTRPGQPGSYALDVVASDSTLRLHLDPDFTLTGISHDRPVTLRSASQPLEQSWRRFLHAVSERDPAAVACAPPDAAATLAVAVAAERALETARAVPVETL